MTASIKYAMTTNHHNSIRIFRLFFTVVLILTQGCSELLYYGQASSGQIHLLMARDNIESLISNDSTDATLKLRLSYLLEAREFATTKLALPTGKAYLDYVGLDRDYVIWNITAAEEFSLTGYQWCYPIVGCQSYRGYFAQDSAREHAASLQNEGLETWVSGVDAYSTLGWFDDPILSTFLKRDDTALAALLFHELAHRVLYIQGDTAFNESFATAVEQAGVRLWMQARGTPAKTEQFLLQKATQRQFIQLVLSANKRLTDIYNSTLTTDEKRQGKAEAIAQLRADFFAAAESNQTLLAYRRWIESEINNAKLITVANYHQHVDAFSHLLELKSDDFAAFYEEVKQLGKLSLQERETRLNVD